MDMIKFACPDQDCEGHIALAYYNHLRSVWSCLKCHKTWEHQWKLYNPIPDGLDDEPECNTAVVESGRTM